MAIDRLLNDAFWSVTEAILVLFGTFLYLDAIILDHGLTTGWRSALVTTLMTPFDDLVLWPSTASP